VQVHGQHPVRASRAEQVGHQLGGDRHPRLVLAILSRVAVVRDHRRNPRGRRPAERVDHDQQLDEMLIDGRAGRLHDEHVRSPDVLVDLERDFRVREPRQSGLPQGNPEVAGNLARQLGVRAASKDLEFGERHPHALTLDGVIDRFPFRGTSNGLWAPGSRLSVQSQSPEP
jgi:hypothetical protein